MNHHSPSKSLDFNQIKGTKKRKNASKILPILLEHLSKGVWTTRGLSKATGVKISTLTRYKVDLEYQRKIFVLFRQKDPITGFPADVYTACEGILSKFIKTKDGGIEC